MLPIPQPNPSCFVRTYIGYILPTHFEDKKISQIRHISQAVVYLQVGRYDFTMYIYIGDMKHSSSGTLTAQKVNFVFLLCSVPDAMLLFTAEVNGSLGVGYDFLYLGIEGGRVVVKFNNFGGLNFTTVSGSSSVSVNDTEIHAVQVLFRSQTVDLLVDNHDRVLVPGKSVRNDAKQ